MAITWTGGTFNSSAFVWNDVVWAGDLSLWIALNGGGGTGTDRIETSPDGATWTTRTTPDAGYAAIDWSDSANLAVAVGLNGVVATSADAVTWTPQTSGNTHGWSGVRRGGSVWVAAGYNSTTPVIMSSADGVTWTLRTTPGSLLFSTNVVYAPDFGRFYLPGPGGGYYTSTDGTTWTESDTGSATYNWEDGFWDSDNARVVLYDVSNGGYAYSTDGTSWTEAAMSGWATGGFTSGPAIVWLNGQNKAVALGEHSDGNVKYAEVTNLSSFPAYENIDAPYNGSAFTLVSNRGSYSPTLGMVMFVSQNSTYDFIRSVGSVASGSTITMGYVSPPGVDYTEDWDDVTRTQPSDLRAPNNMGPLWTALDKIYIGKPTATLTAEGAINSQLYATNNYEQGEASPPIVTATSTNTTPFVSEAPLPWTLPSTTSGLIKGVTWLEGLSSNVRFNTLNQSGATTTTRSQAVAIGTYNFGSSNSDVTGSLYIGALGAGLYAHIASYSGEIPTAISPEFNTQIFVGTHTTSLTDPGKIYVYQAGSVFTNRTSTAEAVKDLADYSGIGGARCALQDKQFLPPGTYNTLANAIGTDAAAGGSAIVIVRNVWTGAWETKFTGSSTTAGNAVTRMMATNRTDGDGNPYTILAYWNGSNQSTIYRSISPYTSWTSVWTEDDPIVGFAQFFYTSLNGVKQYRYLAWTGGDGVTPKLLINDSVDFTSWADITSLLNPATTASGFAGFLTFVN